MKSEASNIIKNEDIHNLDCVYDNTAPQTAWAYFENPSDPFLELDSEKYFIDFITTYINASSIYVPTPSNKDIDANIKEPFLKLWHNSSKVKNNVALDNNPYSPLNPFDDFLYLIGDAPDKWAKWITFQWTPNIVKGYKYRIENWYDELPAYSDFFRDKESTFPPEQIERVGRFKNSLRANLDKLINLDKEYECEIKKRRIDREYYAIAYAYSWFLRGTAYSKKFPDMMLKFHNLRNNISYPNRYIKWLYDEFNWGEIINIYIKTGAIRRNEDILEKLYNLREFIQRPDIKCKMRDYYGKMEQLNNDKPKSTVDTSISSMRKIIIKEIISEAILNSKFIPPYKYKSAFDDFFERHLSPVFDKSGIKGQLIKYSLVGANEAISKPAIRSRVLKFTHQVFPDFCLKLFTFDNK